MTTAETTIERPETAFKMITELRIKNFRLFKNLFLERLSRVNLFVGKNNSGKTSLLEAVRVYAADAAPRDLLDIIIGRGELPSSEKDLKEQTFKDYTDENDNPFKLLFNGFRFPNAGEEGIEIVTNQKELRIVTKYFRYVEADYYPPKQVVAYFDTPSSGTVFGKRVLISQIFNIPDDLKKDKIGGRFLGILSDTGSFIEHPAHFKNVYFPIHMLYIPSMLLNEETARSLWNEINMTETEDEVTKCLQIIEPGIIKFGYKRILGRETPVVRLEGANNPIPLKTMGEGMARLLNVILAMLNAKSGLLIIDEFENGLHWSIENKIWDMVFRLAESLNVQVFATTHSMDCIKGFYKAWAKYEELGSLYRLDPDPEDGVYARKYTIGILSDSLDVRGEVR
ncbi:MAG: AAA family ATPase [Nitrospirae bacterium]|nr:AAA family ATPase [Nitrospirota bacterium]